MTELYTFGDGNVVAKGGIWDKDDPDLPGLCTISFFVSDTLNKLGEEVPQDAYDALVAGTPELMLGFKNLKSMDIFIDWMAMARTHYAHWLEHGVVDET
jgi:hypothetical protein